jgi:hypothetical protein
MHNSGAMRRGKVKFRHVVIASEAKQSTFAFFASWFASLRSQ